MQFHSQQRSRTCVALASAAAFAVGAMLGIHEAKGQISPPVAAPGDTTRTPPEKIVPPLGSGTRIPNAPPGSLSDTLSRQDGVITPPTGIDPEIQKTPPAEGKMRIIPPPGSQGNPSTMQPK